MPSKTRWEGTAFPSTSSMGYYVLGVRMRPVGEVALRLECLKSTEPYLLRIWQ